MTPLQTVGLYGMHICALLFLGLIVWENYLLKKRIKALQDHIAVYTDTLTKSYALIQVQRATLIEAGLLPAPEKPQLHG